MATGRRNLDRMREPAPFAECRAVCQIPSAAEADRLGGGCHGRISDGCAHRNGRLDGDQRAVLGKLTAGLSRKSALRLVYLRGLGPRDKPAPAALSCSDKVPLYDAGNATHFGPIAMPRSLENP